MTNNATPAVSGTVRGVVLLPYQRRFLDLPRGTQLRLACNRKSGRALWIEMQRTRQELLREIQQNAQNEAREDRAGRDA